MSPCLSTPPPGQPGFFLLVSFSTCKVQAPPRKCQGNVHSPGPDASVSPGERQLPHGPLRCSSVLSRVKSWGRGVSIFVNAERNNTKKKTTTKSVPRASCRSQQRGVQGGRSEQRAQRGAAFLYNRNAFCFSFLSFFHPDLFVFVSFCFVFACFFLKMDKMCSSPHDCGCSGERYQSKTC